MPQLYVERTAGDPTDPTSRFAATIDFVDGTPVVTWSPNVTDGSRVYRIWGKRSLADADWTQIDAASIADYNSFKVTVEMKGCRGNESRPTYCNKWIEIGMSNAAV